MRYKFYNRLVLATGDIQQLQFEPSHFKEAGFNMLVIGMPKLEALELINKWNKLQTSTRQFLYWVE